MDIQRVFAVYFSPTHGTKGYVEGIAKRIRDDYEVIDLTKPETRGKTYTFTENDLVILGAPVYAGRLPSVPGGIFDKLKGNHTPAVFNVSYGNRDFDDALLEEKEICEANGFKGIAAAAWIAPHTFSDKIAASRPDDEDVHEVDEFTAQIKIILDGDLPEHDLKVPGNHPYKEAKAMPFHPSGKKTCTGCNICVSVCPVGAISAEDPRKTDKTLCIDCLACAKNCPVDARGIFNPMYGMVVKKLESSLIDNRKDAQLFY